MPSRLGWQYIAVVAVFNVVMEMCYLLGFFFTTSANVLAFASLAPVWAALMSVPALGLRVPRRTVIACIFALAGSVVIGLGFGLGSSTDATQTETYRALGLIFAVGTGLSSAAMCTTVQSAAMRAPETNMLVAHGFGVMLAATVGLALMLSPIFHPEGSSLYPGLVPATL
jgi:drug/metabolite transporter (DMT)-like permease